MIFSLEKLTNRFLQIAININSGNIKETILGKLLEK